jgi:mono/diheme cytochrome c family protein
MFGLDGTLPPAQLGTPVSRQAAVAGAANLVEGKRLFTQACAVCHGDDGKGGHTGGAPLDRLTDLAAVTRTVTAGRNNMPPFGATFMPEQIRDVSAYVVEVLSR